MFSAPAAFAVFRANQATDFHYIVRLTNGTDTWLISDIDMQLTDGHVWPLLKSLAGLREGIDLFTREWTTAEVSVECSNEKYHAVAGGTWKRLSDEVVNLLDKDIEVYIVAGPTATALSDCLKRFAGKITSGPTYSASSITLRGRDGSLQYNRLVPLNTMSSAYASCPDDIANDPIPLKWGAFTFDITNPFGGSGMGKGLPTTKSNLHPVFVFADHACKEITDLWLSPVGLYPVEYDGHTLTANDSGRCTGYGTGLYAWLYLFPSTTAYADVSGAPEPEGGLGFVNPNSKFGGDVYDNYDLGVSNCYGWGNCAYPQDQENTIVSAIGQNDENHHDTTVVVIYKCSRVNVLTTVQVRNFISGSGGWGDGTATPDNTERTISEVVTHPALPNKTSRFIGGLYMSNVSGIGDGVDSNLKLGNLSYMYMKVNWYFPQINAILRILDTNGSFPNEEAGCAVMQGRTFGSWIDNAGRSNSFNAGDLIGESHFIVESLLRDVLGVTAIDEASFDGCTAASALTVDLTERQPAFDVIRKISEQGKFCFMWSAAGKARAIDLGTTSPTTSRKILWSWIMEGSLEIEEVERFCTELDYDGRYQGEYDTLRTHGISGSTAGLFKHSVEWPYIAPAGLADWFRTRLGTNFWEVRFAVAGAACADLEVGDWIEFDAASCDPQVLFKGASWAGKQFIILDVDFSDVGMNIHAAAING